MEKITVFEEEGLYRDPFVITGFRFGSGQKSVCVVGTMRGTENQQLYCCSQLVKRLKQVEEQGELAPGHEIMVIPCVNPYSLNTKMRFWGIDNTDINRMFPGYDKGETTQRIAAGVFEAVKDYEYGIQFTSFYRPGSFVPHVRMMKTGYENTDLACEFGMPYVIIRNPRPYDTTTLNYNWQIWETQAFSIYTTQTEVLDKASAADAIDAILRFLTRRGILTGSYIEGQISRVVDATHLCPIRSKAAGFFTPLVPVGSFVRAGTTLAHITDPLDGSLLEKITSPVDGTIIFTHNEPLTYAATAVFKVCMI